MINLKGKSDIEGIRKAGSIVKNVLIELSSMCEPGLRTIELDKVGEKKALEANALPAFKGYGGFPYSVCVSINDEVVHGFPSQRKLMEGDIVNIDYGIYFDGYYADSAVTVPVGNVTENALRLISTTKESLFIGVKEAVPGNNLNDISSAIEKFVLKNNFSVVRDFVGHGVGFKLHEEPQVPNYYTRQNDSIILEEGLVLAIEPMVNEFGHKIKIKKNGWTVVTRDGGLSAHFEHTVAVTESGPEILT